MTVPFTAAPPPRRRRIPVHRKCVRHAQLQDAEWMENTGLENIGMTKHGKPVFDAVRLITGKQMAQGKVENDS